jgi:hypothetical protein
MGASLVSMDRVGLGLIASSLTCAAKPPCRGGSSGFLPRRWPREQLVGPRQCSDSASFESQEKAWFAKYGGPYQNPCLTAFDNSARQNYVLAAPRIRKA